MPRKRKVTAAITQRPTKKSQRELVLPTHTKSEGEHERQQQRYNQHQSLFFRLPRELRDQIYREIFIFPSTVYLGFVEIQETKYIGFYSFLCQFHQVECRDDGNIKLPPEVTFPPLPPLKVRSDDLNFQLVEWVESCAPVMSMLLSCRRMSVITFLQDK